MKLFWDALFHPLRDRWMRWTMTLLVLTGIATNLWAGVKNILNPEAGLWWVVSVVCVTFLIFYWSYFMMLKNWIPQDEEIRNRGKAPIQTMVAKTFLNSPLPPGAAKPNMDGLPSHIRFVLDQAMRSGEAHIYQDEDGVWRDSITDAKLDDDKEN